MLNSSTPILQYSTSFDAASRLLKVSDGTNSATYSYLANSPLVDHITFTSNSTTVMTTSNRYDYLNRLTGITSVSSALSVVNFQYAYNAANQWTAVTEADNSYWGFGYDSLGQVTNAVKKWSDNSVVAGQQFGYGFDTIGNRKMTLAGGDSNGMNLRFASYTNNALNQITSRDVPGYVDVLGLTLATNTVSVNGTNAYQKWEFFREQMATNNTSAAQWVGINVTAPGQTTVSGHAFLAQTPEICTYDLDGNMTQDGRWTYGWDAENRLTNMTSLSGGPAGSLLKLDFTSDYMGRRIQKIVSTNNGSSYVGSYTNKFVYDGWNVAAILDGGDNLLYSFTWGLDLSGSTQGAGGVGGLISMTVHSGTQAGTYFYCFDGNGNVAALVNAGTGSIAAQYWYGPFGELIRATGPLAFINPFLFSTKYRDSETGFYYYGHRYYNPSTGRWLSRDILEEDGGLNLIGFNGNDAINVYDTLGEYIKSITVGDPDAKGVIKVTIVFKVYWKKMDPNDGLVRSLATQKRFDKQAASIWTGKFKLKTKNQPTVTYDTTTTFESSYGDANDAQPGDPELFTTVMQSCDPLGPRGELGNTVPMARPQNPSSILLFSEANERAYAHEVGHAMGLDEAYHFGVRKQFGGDNRWHDVYGPYSDLGWGGNIMANDPNGKPDGRNIRQIIEIWNTPHK